PHAWTPSRCPRWLACAPAGGSWARGRTGRLARRRARDGARHVARRRTGQPAIARARAGGKTPRAGSRVGGARASGARLSSSACRGWTRIGARDRDSDRAAVRAAARRLGTGPPTRDAGPPAWLTASCQLLALPPPGPCGNYRALLPAGPATGEPPP